MAVDAEKEPDHGHTHSHAHGAEHPEIVALGCMTVGGATFTVDREGQIEAGKETTFGVELVGEAKACPTSAWIANPDGEKLCDPVAGEGHDQHWHFTVCPLMPVKKATFVLKVGEEEASLDFARGAAPSNDGLLSVLKADGVAAGFLELKLHGDAGDLECFLYSHFKTTKFSHVGKPVPLDIPKETVVNLAFPSHEGKTVELKIRNGDKNEDEEGTPNMRGDATNYFIFPGETGADPEWLVGEKWRGIVTVAFSAGGKAYTCDPFVLVPHEALCE